VSSEHAIPLEAHDSDDDDYDYKKEDWFGLVDLSDELERTICRSQDLSVVEMTGQRVRLTFQTWAEATKWLNGIGSAPSTIRRSPPAQEPSPTESWFGLTEVNGGRAICVSAGLSTLIRDGGKDVQVRWKPNRALVKELANATQWEARSHK
jgi:hypothetical protein